MPIALPSVGSGRPHCEGGVPETSTGWKLLRGGAYHQRVGVVGVHVAKIVYFMREVHINCNRSSPSEHIFDMKARTLYSGSQKFSTTRPRQTPTTTVSTPDQSRSPSLWPATPPLKKLSKDCRVYKFTAGISWHGAGSSRGGWVFVQQRQLRSSAGQCVIPRFVLSHDGDSNCLSW